MRWFFLTDSRKVGPEFESRLEYGCFDPCIVLVMSNDGHPVSASSKIGIHDPPPPPANAAGAAPFGYIYVYYIIQAIYEIH